MKSAKRTGSRTDRNVPPATGSLPRASGEREFYFTRHHFDLIAGLLMKLAGIQLAPHKTEMVYSRLARRLRELKLPDFDAYCDYLASPEGAEEIGFLVNALTTNLTRFFREPHHFGHLANSLLPEVLARQTGAVRPRLRLWSAGCSSGEEPYTIAMTVLSTLADAHRWDARILATDIDTHMVETARGGCYAADSASGIPAALRGRYTDERRQGGRPTLVMGDGLKRLITFKPLNLLEDWPMKGPFDAIFCRNVLIYFDRVGRQEVIHRFHRILVEGGYLYLGHSESLYGVSDRFLQVGPTTYRVTS
jgi:chemotaxis protein methyltransferase CheR